MIIMIYEGCPPTLEYDTGDLFNEHLLEKSRITCIDAG